MQYLTPDPVTIKTSAEIDLVAYAYGIHPGEVEICTFCEQLAPPLHPGCLKKPFQGLSPSSPLVGYVKELLADPEKRAMILVHDGRFAVNLDSDIRLHWLQESKPKRIRDAESRWERLYLESITENTLDVTDVTSLRTRHIPRSWKVPIFVDMSVERLRENRIREWIQINAFSKSSEPPRWSKFVW
jgi:hypothetical protein